MSFDLISNAWADGAVAAAPQQNLVQLFLPMVAVFAIFYFMLIRPQQKQQKKMKEMLAKIQKGDEVVTAGGIHGKIMSVTDAVVTIEIADNVRIKVERAQIAQVKASPIEEKKS